jgi:hypothetical protein
VCTVRQAAAEPLTASVGRRDRLPCWFGSPEQRFFLRASVLHRLELLVLAEVAPATRGYEETRMGGAAVRECGIPVDGRSACAWTTTTRAVFCEEPNTSEWAAVGQKHASEPDSWAGKMGWIKKRA